MYCIFPRNQYQSGVVSRRHWSVVACIYLAHKSRKCASAAIVVTKHQHIQIRMCTKTNKRAYALFVQSQHNNVLYIPPQSISIRSRRELSPLQCGCMHIYMATYTRVYVHQNKWTYVLFVQRQRNNVSYIPPKSISTRSREPSALECGCKYIYHTL